MKKYQDFINYPFTRISLSVALAYIIILVAFLVSRLF